MARYEAALKAAQSLGFTYRPAADVGEADLVEFERRIAVAEDAFDQSETIVDAVMGTADEPTPTLNDVWKLYEEHNEAG